MKASRLLAIVLLLSSTAIAQDQKFSLFDQAVMQGRSSICAKGGLITSNDAAGTMVCLAAGTAGYVLTSNGTSALPTWQAIPSVGSYVNLQASSPGTQQTGNINVSGHVLSGADFNVLKYGADPTGAASSTAAFAAAVTAATTAGGGTVSIPTGTFKVGTTTLPAMPTTGSKIRILGAGIGQTVLIAESANTQLFVAASTYSENHEIGGFSVKAHASGSTGAAFNLENTNHWYIHDIEYQSNGTGNYTDLFYLHAPIICYSNRISHVVVKGQSGPAKLVHSYAPGSSNEQANLTFVDHWLIETNTGISRIFDLGETRNFHISNCMIEGNTGAIVLVPGQGTTMEECWLEANADPPIVPEAGHNINPSNVVIRNNILSGMTTLTLTSICTYWTLADNIYTGALADGGTFNNLQAGNSFQNGLTVNSSTVTGTAKLGYVQIGGTDLGLARGAAGQINVTNGATSDPYGSLRLYQITTLQAIEILADGLYDRGQIYLHDGSNYSAGLKAGSAGVVDVTNGSSGHAPIRPSQYLLSALNTAPSSASDTGTLGEIRVTATYIYVCTATNTWVRAALASW